MPTPQIPGGECPHCHAPVIDLFAEWTDEYQTSSGKKAILAGNIVFDCCFCQGPIQLVLPLAIESPRLPPGAFFVAKRSRTRCDEWLLSQHPGYSLSQVIEMAALQHGGKWAFEGYNWKEGTIHQHGVDAAPVAGSNP
jgi:hypothetical protein